MEHRTTVKRTDLSLQLSDDISSNSISSYHRFIFFVGVYPDSLLTPPKFSLKLAEFGAIGAYMSANSAEFEAQVVWDIFKLCYLYTRQAREHRSTYYRKRKRFFRHVIHGPPPGF